MKKKFLTYAIVAGMGFGAVSCDDMLSPDSERHSYEVAQDTLYSYWGILRSLQNVAERYVVLGECRGELVTGTSYLSDTIECILNYDMTKAVDGSCRYLKAADYYHVINSCNAYLASYDSTRTTGTLQPYMTKEAAQVSAIRAWTYLQLCLAYGEVPFYTEPLLTSDAINNFAKNYASNGSTVTIDNLADKFVDELESAASVEAQYGFPQYDTYGYTATVAHSSKLMIPVNVILGDLYLAKGDKTSCAKAAQYYFNYLSGNNGLSIIPAGGVIPAGYSYSGYLGDGMTEARYSTFGSYSSSIGGSTPWTETGETTRVRESVTAIASSTNKLWGTVLRGVNELYGFDADISVRTSTDSTTSASVTLEAQYDKKQLLNSQAYLDLCAEQQFEEYIGSSDQTTWSLTVDPSVSDARQYWLTDYTQSYSNGTRSTEKFITKLNPSGQFTTVAHMIYRKSQIWLRFAEAICNAGYPSFAFAILKDGLCNASYWLPEANTTDYEVTEWLYSYTDDDGNEYTSTESKEAIVDQLVADMTFETDEEKEETVTSLLALVDSTATAYAQWPDADCDKIIDYISLDENTDKPSYLNFDLSTFQGNLTSQLLLYRTSLSESSATSTSEDYTYDESLVNGIHCRGNGYLRYSDRHNSAYNYVDMVAKKASENYGVTLTKEKIYDSSYKDIVIKCVEDLIVDEEALELAFEGTRFFDLMRVAHRRGDPSYLANKLAKRNSALASKLLSEKNWYFPLPTE